MLHVLELLNNAHRKSDIIRNLLFMIKTFTGFEAVGLRLKAGDDFPYYETHGFPAEFVEAERSLYVYDESGTIAQDAKGRPLLKCMCGNVLCGRTNPARPFFTEGGSFWTNSTTELLASMIEEDLQVRMQERCNSEGYESVALIPLFSENTRVGLLQLNDRRKGLLTLEQIRFFEGLGASIGIAFARKQAEEALQEKNARMQEILYRTKNNMAAIWSLLRLQSDQIKDAQMLRIFQDAENRIRSLALMQEQLYRTEHLNTIDLKGYLHDLAYTVFVDYQVRPGKIALKFDLASVIVSPDTATPCGLILHELLSNIMKYAFPGERTGEICIGLHTSPEGEITLCVRDNGVGMPENIDPDHTPSLGLRLVMTFVRQLGGTLERLKHEQGAEFCLRFRDRKSKKHRSQDKIVPHSSTD